MASLLNFLSILKSLATVDLRSLALCRILLSAAILINVIPYWPYLDVFFAPQTGLALRTEAIQRRPEYWSLLYVGDSMLFVYGFFLVYTLAALALLFGYKTRLATIVCWICTVSLKNRGYQFTNYGDILHGIYLFWAMFLPLGAVYSVDAALNKKTLASTNYASVASLALLLNVTYVYFFGALHKTGYDWQNLTAIHYALSNLELTTPFAPYLLQQNWLIAPLTAYVYYLELLAPLLLFLPLYTAHTRLIAVPLLLSLHIGFALFLTVNIFSVVAAAGVIAFLPALFWDRIILWFNNRASRRGIHIFYDRDCEFCLKLCRIFRTLGLPADTPITPAQEDPSAGPILTKENTWVVRTHDNIYLTHWEAVSYLWRCSPLLWPLGVLFLLPGLRQCGHGLYLLIARYRGQLASLSARFLPYEEKSIYAPTRITQLFLVAMMALVLAQNLRTVSYFPRRWPSVLEELLLLTDLKQRWLMYAPYVKTGGDWLVIEGTTPDGGKVDLLHTEMQPPSHERPAHAWATHPDSHMRRYLSFSVSWKKQGDRVARYFCNQFAEKYPELPVEKVTIYKYWQLSALQNEPTRNAEQRIVYTGKCAR